MKVRIALLLVTLLPAFANAATYNVLASEDIPTPTFTPESGSTIAFGDVVTINYDKAFSLYYTTDGSDPKTSATLQLGFNNPETIITDKEGTLTIKAFLSNKDGESDVVTATYTVEGKPTLVGNPTFDPAPGAVEKGTQVHIIFGENATSVSFSTDGSSPLLGDVFTSSKQIDAIAPIIINEETTIKAICRTNEGGKTYSSEIVTVTYTVKDPSEDTDGIGQMVNNAIADGEAYNLNGQRVRSNYKGVVIIDGKKYCK